jgi:quinoprotein glucose dehydrogenase
MYKLYRSLAILFLLTTLFSCGKKTDVLREWRHYLGDPGSSQYSTLTQIDTTNVQLLEVAWAFSCGDTLASSVSQIQCNPIVVDSILFATSPRPKLLALHAGTGELIWKFDPFAVEESAEGGGPGLNRGVMYWESGPDQRVFFSAGSKLFAIDAKTGDPVSSFGKNGSVDLRQHLGRDVEGLSVAARTPGVIYEDILIIGSSLGEGPAPAAPGHIKAYDVRTGALKWRFNTIPHPGEFGYDTWPPSAYLYAGGTNSWSGMTLDEDRGIVYVPTGSPTFDFWGGDRIGKNLFGNCLLALNAETGERIWHFQVVHHDIWDRDLPMPPNLVTVRHDGRRIDAIAQATKAGLVFLFDRETGEPLFPIEERPVPGSDLPGEETWPTQPFPVKPPPFARQYLKEEDLARVSDESFPGLERRFRGVRSDGQFVAPSREGTIIFPGFDGGGEWGGAAVDPSGIMYINSNEMPWILRMVDARVPLMYTMKDAGDYLYAMTCASCHGVNRKGNGVDYPGLENIDKKLSPEEMVKLLKSGRGRMPAFANLTAPQLEAIVAYLYSLPDSALVAKVADIEIDRALMQQPFNHTGYNRFVDKEGNPAVKPPWGTMNAIDLNRGEILWQVPFGELDYLTERGIPQTGTENYGGPVVTAGGLIFIGATKDEKFRAFRKRDGKVLWETRLPAGGYATPCTYELQGRQYIVIACGGGKMGTDSGDQYVAFALPELLN